MNFIDTHLHLDLFENPEGILNDIENRGIYTLAVTNTPSVFHFTKKITQDKKYIRAALGLHPELAEQRIKELSLFEDFINETRYIGEVGIDNIKKCSISSRDAQLKVFSKVLQLTAEAKNKVITIHSRGSEIEVIERIGQNFPGTIILHWYSGSLQNLEKAIANGFFFSVNKAMCQSQNGQRIIKRIPFNRLLTESDGPFIKVGSKLNSPLLMEETLTAISSILSKELSETTNVIFNNFKHIINIKS